jgi:sulfite reductase (ferredoxin)
MVSTRKAALAVAPKELMTKIAEADPRPEIVKLAEIGPNPEEQPWKVHGKMDGVEDVKAASGYHRAPLLQELEDLEATGLSKAATVIMKHHGSYVQANREVKGKKTYQFMLRLKVPAGVIPADLYRLLDDFCDTYGQHDLRITTRQAFQIHGILKQDLKAVIGGIMNFGSSTISGCGDVSRNVMVPPAPINSVLRPEYRHAREWAFALADLFKPQSTAFSEIWLDGKKATTVEYWKKDYPKGVDPVAAMHVDTGKGIITNDPVEPIYGDQYLPKKFKMAVTVPTDNSLDLYINDIGVVVITDPKKGGEVEGFNIVVGGGLGRTHKKEATFARAADHLGYVPKDKLMETLKAILATYRDYGNREVRANARLKYLVHKLGIDKYRDLVHAYLPEPWIEPWREIPPWEYKDWMGWHEQGDGKLFLGLPIDSGRVRDFEDGPKIKTALRKIVDNWNYDLVLSPTQSLLIKDIDPANKVEIEDLLREHNIPLVEEIDALDRLGMACPALPLCGLAVTEAERRLPNYTARIRAQLRRSGMGDENIMIRMTGCPNGCGRPYMTEIGFVGDGRDTYQLWVGGSPTLDGRTGFALMDRVKDKNMEETLAALFAYWRDSRSAGERFGDFTHRMGKEDILAFVKGYTVTEADLKDPEMYDDNADSESDESIAEISPVMTQDQLNAEMAAARPAGPEATKAAMDARIAEDKEVAKETVLGQVTRVGAKEEVSAEEKQRLAAEKKAKAEADAAAAMNRAQKAAEEERERQLLDGTATEKAVAKAEAKAATKVDEEAEKAEMASRAAARAAADDEIEAQIRAAVAAKKATAAKPAVAEQKPTQPSAEGEGLIREVFAYRVFKNNAQWCVEWTADGSVSWESWDRLDSDNLREKALVLKKDVSLH